MSQHRRRPAGGRRPRPRAGVYRVTAAAAALAVGAGAVLALHGFGTPGYDPAGAAAAQVPASRAATLLRRDRRQLIFSLASRSMTLVAAPQVASVPVISAGGTAGPAGAPSQGASPGSPGPPGTGLRPPSPGTAEGIAYRMLPSFGFSPATQFSCLYDMWTRESGWNYRAVNPSSGAYGIPQSLPASKMASAGADWATDPATQIRWGLGYIRSTYGSPCGAWSFWQAHGWY